MTPKLYYIIVLYCIVLYCIVLYCIVLYCIVLYCIVLLNSSLKPQVCINLNCKRCNLKTDPSRQYVQLNADKKEMGEGGWG